MKYINNINMKCWIMALLLSGGLFSACSEEVVVGQIDENKYMTGDGSLMGYIADSNGKRMFSNVDFRSKGDISFHLKIAKKSQTDVTVKAVYDEMVMTEYNNQYGTNYEVFPQNAVTLAENGLISLEANAVQSSEMKVTYVSDGTLSPEKTYVIPLRMEVVSGDIKLAKEDQTRLILVKDLTGIPDCTKYVNGAPGVKVFSCMEVNDTNPLNNLCFTLKNSKKPLVDVLIIFASNVKYSEENGRVYIYNNENVQALLDNREHYLKPLKDRGMKVVLGLLDGFSNLSQKEAARFAQDVKAMCDAYDLDGIFVDDEYSKYPQDNIPPGFVAGGSEGAARFCYEVKKAQPDRWVVAYVYGLTRSLSAVDGMPSGEYVDYALHDYGGSYDLNNSFPGLPKANMGLHSQEFNLGRMAEESDLRQMREDGYLSHMIFAMGPCRANFERVQLPAMERMARAFYDDELVWDGIKYEKDW